MGVGGILKSMCCGDRDEGVNADDDDDVNSNSGVTATISITIVATTAG